MSDAGSQGDLDLSKLKVADLKKMLKSRGLSVIGNKQELIDRLQKSEAAAEALIEGSDADGDVGDIDEELDREIDEAALEDPDDATKPEPEIEEPLKNEGKTGETPKPAEPVKPADTPVSKDKPTEAEKKDGNDKLNGTTTSQEKPKHKRITITDVSVSDVDARKKARLERFNQTPAATAPAKTETTDVLSKRAARFAAAAPTKTEATSTVVNDPLKKTEATPKPDGAGAPDKLKKRAERFGILSPAEAKKQQLEKLQARKARFAAGATPAVTSTTTTTATAEPEKTSVPPIPAIKTAASVDEKKRLRAERFKIKV